MQKGAPAAGSFRREQRRDQASQPPQPKAGEKSKDDRVARACKTCRKRKVRCSGHLPRCTNCQTNLLECHYEPARRDRLKEATQLNHSLVALLRDLGERVGDEDREKIEAALEDAEDDLTTQAPNPIFPVSLGKRDRQGSNEDDDNDTVISATAHGEAHVTASAGSNEDLDNIDEDLTRSRGSRATGYVGQNSEVQWLRSAQRQIEHPGAEPYGQLHGPPGTEQTAVTARSAALHVRRDNARDDSVEGSMRHITDSTFYLDNEELDLDVVVDPNEDPPPDVAERLFRCYFETVHSSFPLVPETFEPEFQKYLHTLRTGGAYQITRGWRAQMNLILAIGAKYSHLTEAEWRGDDRDHLIYMLRATHLLGLKDTIMIIAGPDLRLVQATSALSFYFLVTGHVSRAWILIGVSIRLALALGLHLRNEDRNATEARKETLVHTWWSLHSIECLVSTMTGRPPVFAFEDCTVPLPHERSGASFDDTHRPASRRRTGYESSQATGSSNQSSEHGEQQSGHGYHFLWHVKVTLISQKALLELYSPRTASKSWQDVQRRIAALLVELEDWANSALPQHLATGKRKSRADMTREQFLLSTNYWSTKILITRPCLCRIERRIQNESDVSATFNKNTATACVGAALELTSLFPDQPDFRFLYKNGPWWASIHLFMQALAVLLLELSYGFQDATPPMTAAIKKLIRWLRAMKRNDHVARRAYDVIWRILKNCAPSLQKQANDLLAQSDVPETHPWGVHNMRSDFNVDRTARNPHQASPMDPTFGGQAFQQQQHPLQQQQLGTFPGFQDDMTAYFPPDEQLPNMAFGTPFFTTWDQGAPVMSMQDLWNNAGTSNAFDTGLAGMQISQRQLADDDDALNTFPTQQQQQHDHQQYHFQRPQE